MLVLVDFQDYFVNGNPSEAWNADLASVVEVEIAKAKRRKDHIVSLLFRGCGPLKPEVKAMIGDYDLHRTGQKSGNDGSLTLLRHMGETLLTDSLLFLGGNISFCLGQTVIGLAERLRKREIEPRLAVNLSGCYDGRFFDYNRNYRPDIYRRFVEEGVKVRDPLKRWDFEELRPKRRKAA